MANDARTELRLPSDLKDWAKKYAEDRGTTVSALVTRFLRRLKHEEEKKQHRVDADQV